MPPAIRKAARRRQCQVCASAYGSLRAFRSTDDKTFMKIVQHIDHLLPRRWLESQGIDPHQKKNLLSVCGSCHGKKKGFEDRLFAGDFIGWLSGLRTVNYPVNDIINFALSIGLKQFEKCAFTDRGRL
jgi:hypothetical protein